MTQQHRTHRAPGFSFSPCSGLRCLAPWLLAALLLGACDSGGGQGGADSGLLPPANVRASQNQGNITLSWDPVAGATSYTLYLASQPGINARNYGARANGRRHEGISGTQITVPGTFRNHTPYYFAVSASDGKGEGATSRAISLTIDIPPPAFAALPTLSADAPSADTPLARLLTVNATSNCRVSVVLSNDTQSLRIDFNDYGLEHSLPLLGLRAGTTYTTTVQLINRADEKLDAERNLLLTTAPLPDGFPAIDANGLASRMEPGFTLFNVIPEGDTNKLFRHLLVAVDAAGKVVWYQRGAEYLDVRQQADGNLMVMEGNSLVEMTMLGEHLREWKAVGAGGNPGQAIPVQAEVFHHDMTPMPNGHFLTLSIETRNYDQYPSSETDITSPPAPALVVGDVVVEFAADGSVVQQWKLLDMLDPLRIGYGSVDLNYWDVKYPNQDPKDWAHANAVLYDASDDSIIVSLRHQDAIVKFGRENGELRWILGPHDNWDATRFGPYLLTPLGNEQYFFPFHPHAPAVMSNGHILVFDNGNERASPPQPKMAAGVSFSRAAEYEIDAQAKTVKLVWQYGENASPRRFSPFLGDADELPITGNILITFGSLIDTNNTYTAAILETPHTADASPVLQLTVTDPVASGGLAGWRVYRAERIPDLYSSSQARITYLP